MVLFVNNEQHVVDSDLSLFDFLSSIQMSEQKGIAIAVNEEVIPKSEWSSESLKDQDKILIIKATQGG